MSRFNNIKTSFTDSGYDLLKTAVPREEKARVNYIFKSKDPNQSNLFFIKASIISVRVENQLNTETTVKGSGKKVPEQEFLLNELTNITVIPISEGLPQPIPGDEISVELVVSEVTKTLNIDGYYKRIIKKTEGPRTNSVNDKTELLKNSFDETNSLGAEDVEIPPIDPDQKDLNPQVLALANSYSGFEYRLGGTGNPISSLKHKGSTILKLDNYIYCSAFTFYVTFTVLQQGGYLEDKTISQLRNFQKDWFGINGETELLSSVAISKLAVGNKVSRDDAKAGDICQYWRGVKDGHSVIFLDWVYGDTGEKIGISYRGSQKRTGVANNIEYFTGVTLPKGKRASIISRRIYFARLLIQE